MFLNDGTKPRTTGPMDVEGRHVAVARPALTFGSHPRPTPPLRCRPENPMPLLPPITWPEFLRAGPYFEGAIGHGLEGEAVLDAAPLHRAAYFYNLFDGEVGNGGVIQYFFNQALYRAGFERAPAFVAENPVLAPALPFLREAHAAWESVAPAVRAAREAEEWPETLFTSHRDRFADLEGRFFKINHGIAQRLAADIVARPGDYFAFAPVPGVPERGVAHVVLWDGACRLRFEDGFPVGPNIFEARGGGCDVVWFSRDRTLMTCETGYGGARSRDWIHYPTQRSSRWYAAEDGSREIQPSLALWTDHGLRERFRPDGSPESASFSRNGVRIWSESNFDPDGTPGFRMEHRAEGDVAVTTWPGGAPNTESVDEEGGRRRFLRCLDEAGRDLAPGGTGRLRQPLGERGGRRHWREGALVDGYMEGVVRWMSSAPDGGDVREDERATYRRGVETRGK